MQALYQFGFGFRGPAFSLKACRIRLSTVDFRLGKIAPVFARFRVVKANPAPFHTDSQSQGRAESPNRPITFLVHWHPDVFPIHQTLPSQGLTAQVPALGVIELAFTDANPVIAAMLVYQVGAPGAGRRYFHHKSGALLTSPTE